jgi:hypothetical protein
MLNVRRFFRQHRRLHRKRREVAQVLFYNPLPVPDSLCAKYSDIAKDFKKFAGYVKMAEAEKLKSGETRNALDVLNTAHESFKTMEGREFTYQDCWGLIKSQPICSGGLGRKQLQNQQPQHQQSSVQCRQQGQQSWQL